MVGNLVLLAESIFVARVDELCLSCVVERSGSVLMELVVSGAVEMLLVPLVKSKVVELKTAVSKAVLRDTSVWGYEGSDSVLESFEGDEWKAGKDFVADDPSGSSSLMVEKMTSNSEIEIVSK